jgi:hypothetical protein
MRMWIMKAILPPVLLLCALSMSACMSPTDPDTPRKRITDPRPTFQLAIDIGEYDLAYSVLETADHGFVLTGKAWNAANGSEDLLLLKTDADGSVQWQQLIGGVYNDYGYRLAATSDGGYIIAGQTGSYSNGMLDAWIVKTDANGKQLWHRSYGGSGYDGAWDVRECPNGDFIVAGYTEMNGGGEWNAWLIRLDPLGNEVWNRIFGSGGFSSANSVIPLEEGGFLVNGSVALNEDVYTTLWLFQITDDGALLWEKKFDGDEAEMSAGMRRSTGGSLAMLGNRTYPQEQNNDIVLTITDDMGREKWNRNIATSTFGTCVAPTADGGFLVTGYTDLIGRDGSDVRLFRLGSDGALLWEQRFGGSRMDRAYNVIEASDGGIVIVGSTASFGSGTDDILLIKTNARGDFE